MEETADWPDGWMMRMDRQQGRGGKSHSIILIKRVWSVWLRYVFLIRSILKHMSAPFWSNIPSTQERRWLNNCPIFFLAQNVI